MLAEVSGHVLALRLDGAVVAVGGLGLAVRATPRTLAGLRLGAEVRLATTLVVREDSLTLFGFAQDDERDVFEVLQTVSGVGPRLAMAVLAVLDPDDLRRAVAAEDVAALVRVPGIGRKGAQRMLLELGDRLGPPHGAPAVGGAAPEPAPSARPTVRDQVVAALVGLGWPSKQSEDAVDAVLAGSGEGAGSGAGGGGAGAAAGASAAAGTGAAAGAGGVPGVGEDDAAALLRTALRGLART